MRRPVRTLVGLAAFIAIVWLSCGRQGPGTDREPRLSDHAVSGQAAGDVREPDTLGEVRVGQLRRGSTLQKVLEEEGLTAGEALSLSRAVDGVHSVRALKAGTPYSLAVTRDGQPVRFEMWPDPVEGVSAVFEENEWRAAAAERRLDRHVRYLSGEITESLYASLIDAGGDPALVLEVSDILQWDVDFFVDPRPGDRFALLVEEWADGREIVRHGPVLAIEYRGEQASADAYLYHDETDGEYYHADGTSVRRSLLKSPLNYRRISSHFSHRRFHPILHTYRPHLGVDYAAPIGTPVVALGDGTVEFAGRKGGYGRMVRVRHNSRLTTQYAHFARFAKGIRRGAKVKQGQVIGFVGSSGLSTGPHLDFRCEVSGRFVNPLTLQRPPAEPIPDAHRDRFLRASDAYHLALTTLGCNGFLTWQEFSSHFLGRVALKARKPGGQESRAG